MRSRERRTLRNAQQGAQVHPCAPFASGPPAPWAAATVAIAGCTHYVPRPMTATIDSQTTMGELLSHFPGAQRARAEAPGEGVQQRLAHEVLKARA